MTDPHKDKSRPAANEPKVRPGDRVVRVVADSHPPEGTKGTVLGTAAPYYPDKWEVEYDGFPCPHHGRSGAYPQFQSQTSWVSREEAIELTREEIQRRIANG